jgi:tight adherence protein C
MLINIITALVFITFLLFFRSVMGILLRDRYAVNVRLERIAGEGRKDEESELSKPLFSRFIRPMLDSASRIIVRVTPKEILNAFEKRVVNAGSPYNMAVRDWINLQVLIMLCLPVLTVTLGYYLKLEARTMLFLSAVEVGTGLILPNLILNKKAIERHKKITNTLPDIIDLLTVSVEAGLGFDGALSKVIEKMPGPLAMEFDRVLQEIKVGKQKRDALKDMANRVCVQDVTTFVSSIVQADQFGVGIGNVLRIQSEQMRQKRRQRAQEKAMKAPVKMLIPMVLFILPTVFSVLMGPVVIRLVDVFMKR